MNKIYDSTLAILKRTKKQITTKRSFLTIFSLAVFLNFSFATNYYNYTGAGFTTTATTLSNWTTDATGATLVSQPSNFTTANNIFTVRSGTTINVTSGNAWSVTGAGSGIVVNGTLALAAQLTVGGDLTLNTGGVFTPNTQTVVLNGTALQTIGGTASTVNFYILTINNGAIATNIIPITIANNGAFNVGTGNSAGPTYTMGADITMGNSTTATTTGMCTLNCGAYTLSGGTSSTFTMSNVNGGNYSTLASGSPYGITASTTGATGGSIQTATRNYSTSGAYAYNAASGNQVTGNGLPATILALTINTTIVSQIVSLTRSNTLISFQNPGGNLNLTSGILKIGGDTLSFGNGVCTITSTANGSLANVLSGGSLTDADGGTINMSTNHKLIVNSPAGTAGNPTLRGYNFIFSNTAQFEITNANSLLINGTFSIPGNNFIWSAANSAMYGPASTLSYNCGGQAFVGGTLSSSSKSWLSNTTNIIGSAAGYPNNVILSNTNGVLSTMTTADWSINGVLTLRNSTNSTQISFINNTANFNCGGIVIESGCALTGPTGFDINIHDSASNSATTNNGNWLRTGTFVHNSTRAVNFTGGSGATCATPQLIAVSSGTETLINNLKISGGTFTKLNSPLTLPAAGVLTLTSGVLTTGTNVLSITNTAAAAIIGGSPTAYINGPVTRSLPAGLAATTTYAFPVGDNVGCTNASPYLPFVIKPQTTGATTATVTAFNSFSGGTTGIVGDTLSKTEYWLLSSSAALGSSSTIDSLQRFSSVIPAGASIVTSGTQNAVYATINGTATGNNTIKNSAIVGSSATAYYFALSIKNIILPLRLLSFTGKTLNQRSILQWQTANEINTDHFELYKSADGINFTYLTTIPAIKTGNNNYTNVDGHMFTGNNYYRLKTIDNDGRAYFSDIVLIKNTGTINFIIYPNPTVKQLIVEHNNATNKAQINIFNLAGQKLLSLTTKQSYKETIDVSRLQTGTYLLEYIDGHEIVRQKFVKTDQ